MGNLELSNSTGHQRQQAEPTIRRRRLGLIAARIGSEHSFTLSADMLGQVAGTTVHTAVHDITRYTNLEGVRWVCNHPRCREAVWESKADLFASHPLQSEMVRNDEVHVFFGVLERPAQEAVAATPARKDPQTGKKIPGRRAQSAQPAALLLLSDEE